MSRTIDVDIEREARDNGYPNILILMDLDRAYERGWVNGILQYSRLHGPFNFLRSETAVLSDYHHLTLEKIRKWRPDGVIWREGQDIGDIESLGVPTIYFPHTKPKPNLCNVITDDQSIGKQAAEYLMKRGLEHFAFCGLDEKHYWSSRRKRAFVEAVETEGYQAHTFDMLESEEALTEWISKIPLPTGLMICTDDCSLECYNAVRRAGLKIPDDVAIIGVDNDAFICEFNNPPMSTVQLNLEEAGFRAARQLHKMIKGDRPNEDILVEVFDVVERESSNFLAVKDEVVAKALRFIYEHRAEAIDVEDVLGAVPVSRRVLYRRFHEQLGRTIAKEICMVRINHAAQTLVNTNFTISEVCEQLGYDAPQNFARAFLRVKGVSPSQYRAKYSLFR